MLEAILCILPPLLLTYRVHYWSHVGTELCVILPCYFSVKGHQNLFPTFFPLPCRQVLLFGLSVPHLYNLLGWKFLCSQFGESTLAKPLLYTSHVILFITIKLRPAMGVSQSHFHPCGFCVLIAHYTELSQCSIPVFLI